MYTNSTYITDYVDMLLKAQQVPFLYKVLAQLATWMLLAGFVTLPGTFDALSALTPSAGSAEARAVHAAQQFPV